VNGEVWQAVEPVIRRAQPNGRLPAPNGSGWIASLHSPLRQDSNPSFSVMPDNGDPGAWKDFGTGEGGSLIDLARKLGVELPRRRGGDDSSSDVEQAWFSWCARRCLDPHRLLTKWGGRVRPWYGRPAYLFPTPLGVDRVRFLDGGEKKTTWAKRGGGPCWYGLDRARDHLGSDSVLYLVNGEPSVWACHQSGVPAICTCMAEETPPRSQAVKVLGEALAGRPVAVVYDLDPAGRRGAVKMVEALRAGGVAARALALPEDLGEHGDVDDLHRRVGDSGLAAALADLREFGAPTGGGDEAERILPTVQVNGRQLIDIITDAWAALLGANTRPDVFARAGSIVRLKAEGESEVPSIHQIGIDEAYGHLLRVARWVVVKMSREDVLTFEAHPPKDVARDLLAYPHPGLPPLDAVVASPVFDAAGQVVSAPGYHADARLWYHERDGFTLPPVPTQPTPEEVAAARSLLLDDLLVDFPFVTQADRAHAVAAFLLPFVRRLIDGCTPLHLISAPCPGSGKGLLSNLIGIVAVGVPPDGRVLPERDDEIRKMLFAELLKAQPLILLDNADEHSALRSPSLASILTSEFWADRYLGLSQVLSARNQATWLMTGNNPRLSLELARRCIRIRIDPKRDTPWKRDGFRHDPIAEWAADNRPRLVWACLVLVQAWLAGGARRSRDRLGSFERWAGVIGGILGSAGIPGFLGNLDDLYEEADTEGQVWREFVTAWWEKYRDRWQSGKTLLDLVIEKGLLGSVVGDKSPRSQQVKLGTALQRLKGRVFCDRIICVEHDPHTKASKYRLAEVGKEAQTATGDTGSLFPGTGRVVDDGEVPF